MLIQKQQILSFNQENIWHLFFDFEAMARIIPLVTRIEEITYNQYKAIADLEVGSITGALQADLGIENKKPFDSFILRVNYSHFLGKIIGNFQIILQPISTNETRVKIKGRVKMTRLLKVATYAIKPASIDSLMVELFSRLKRELRILEKNIYYNKK